MTIDDGEASVISRRRLGVRWRQIDVRLLAATVALVGLGIALVASATWHFSDNPGIVGNTWLAKHLAFVLIGFGVSFLCLTVDPRLIRAGAFGIYGFSLITLLAVLALGHGSADYGAQRWIEVGGIPLQPSEPAKLALIIVLARVLAGEGTEERKLILATALTVVPCVLIYLQPGLGTALTLIATWFGMLVLSGTSRRYILGLIGLGVVATPIALLGLRGYMLDRLRIFLDPGADALGEGYNILQAQISIGSGGMWGKGLLEGSQTQLRYLRVSHSDFIFSVLGEELGFVGAMVFFALLLVLISRGLRGYELAGDRFTSLVCAGVVSMIAFQSVINLGANVGLTPVTGIPLPFVSYGGSALITQLAAVGLMQAAFVRRRLYRFET